MVQIDGFVASGFERVAEAFAANFEAGEELGAGFAAIRDGETLVNIWGGMADRAQSKPWARDTLVPVYSTTKGVSAFIIARLVDQGLISYDQTVASLWPEFGAHGKDTVTIAQALSHQAGVPGFPDPIDPMLWLDPPALSAALAQLAPMWAPGTAHGYHPLTWGYILGEIAQRASGRSLGTILREDICAPLGIDFHIGLPDDQHERCAEMMKPKRVADFGTITPPIRAAFFQPWSAAAKGTSTWRRIEIPSANGHGTAFSVAQLYALYAQAGMVADMPVLSANGFAQLIEPRAEGADLVLPFDLDWRTGVLSNSNLFYGPNRRAFGHSGAGGSCGLGDPHLKLSVGYVMSKHSHHVMGDPRSLRLIEALYACL